MCLWKKKVCHLMLEEIKCLPGGKKPSPPPPAPKSVHVRRFHFRGGVDGVIVAPYQVHQHGLSVRIGGREITRKLPPQRAIEPFRQRGLGGVLRRKKHHSPSAQHFLHRLS